MEKFTRTVLRGGDDGNIIPLTRPQVDQGANSKQATLLNAQIEGVAERIEILDGDVRELPLPDASIDVVVASKSIHNIPDRSGRFRALQEIMRVLRPGGRVALMDIFGVEEFATDLQTLGMQEVTVTAAKHFAYPPLRIVTGHKRKEHEDTHM